MPIGGALSVTVSSCDPDPLHGRYELILTKTSTNSPLIVDGGGFNAIDADEAKIGLAAALKDIKSTGPTRRHF